MDDVSKSEKNPLNVTCEGCLYQDDDSGYCTNCYNDVKFSPKRIAEQVMTENEVQKKKK